HIGLAENVLDHRLNSRTVYMNPISRFIYWNMNYHVEHHMFPLVPYHALPKLHAAVKDDLPPVYPNILSAWKELLPTIFRQRKDPGYYVKRELPAARAKLDEAVYRSTGELDADGWIDVCSISDIGTAEIVRFDHAGHTFAIARLATGELHGTDGICTHGNTHLVDGMVIDGMIECAKHNGRFNLSDGSPARAPVCRGLKTYSVKEREDKVAINLGDLADCTAANDAITLRVVSNKSVATFIKELVLEPVDSSQSFQFNPGEYLQLLIPRYEKIEFKDFDIPEPYKAVWEAQHLFDLSCENKIDGRFNNYSFAGNPLDKQYRFNIRISMPPVGQDCPPGLGSSYVFNLKAGDEVSAIGPFGDFHIKSTDKEMIYIGGGAGMAPLRSQLEHLFENDQSKRKISYWYGARAKQELFYAEYFESLAQAHENFDFHIALSDALPEDDWTGPSGFIHDVVKNDYLQTHADITAIEFYLCGPPMMIKACTQMLKAHGVTASQIAFDEF
ncbi:MAG: NADH:ubiquinone reductase (Na(+)-transporting) subunit F, partial [Lentisphaeria bacterium]|nr:NADH:ubiquinone reductase (Na(+)-transporting) subunit F [Lentisphaeria bacterium]